MKKTLLLLAVLMVGYQAYEQYTHVPHTIGAEASNNLIIVDAFRKRRSNIQVQGSGTVVKLLADDREGAPHQRFIVRVSPEQTVLIAHNIELSPRIEELRAGESVEFSGEYEWNERGGVVHWTHRDPQRQHPAGWILFRGRLYQ